MTSTHKFSSLLGSMATATLAGLLVSHPLVSYAEPKNTHWVGTWACSPLHPVGLPDASSMQQPDTGAEGTTIREVVHVSIGGDTVRVRFSNLYGLTSLDIGAADIALTQHGPAIVSGTDHAMTFHGHATVSVPPGSSVLSDPISLKVAALADLTVSFYLPSPSGAITEHELANATSYHAAGNTVSQASLESPVLVRTWEYLNGIDVLTAKKDNAIVTLGDSITDGAYATVDGNNRWPDELARRLQGGAHYRHFSVLNEAISGNQILREGAGPSALARFDRDVMAESGAKYLIIIEGINDIGHIKREPIEPTTADDLIMALDQIVQRAHTHGILVIGGTLTPYQGASYYSDKGETIRTTVNQWIRTSGTFDGVIDFDAALRDPAHPDRLLPSYEHGDHLHPNDAGYKAMGDAVDLKLFTLKAK